MSEANATAQRIEVEVPESLRRLGPARVSIVDDQGQPAEVSRKGVRLYSGQIYTIRVRPQLVNYFGEVSSVQIDPEKRLDEASVHVEARRRAGVTEYEKKVRGRLPYRCLRPSYREVLINLNHPHWGQYTMRVPIVIDRPMWKRVIGGFLISLLIVLGSKLLFIGTELDSNFDEIHQEVAASLGARSFWVVSVVIALILLGIAWLRELIAAGVAEDSGFG